MLKLALLVAFFLNAKGLFAALAMTHFIYSCSGVVKWQQRLAFINTLQIIIVGNLLWYKGNKHFGMYCLSKIINFGVETVSLYLSGHVTSPLLIILL